MDITSFHFIVFLIIFVFVYYLFPAKLRLIPTILASCLFIITLDFGLFLFLLVYLFLNYILIYCLNFTRHLFLRRLFTAVSILFNLAVLISFKYLPFIFTNLKFIFPQLPPSPASEIMAVLAPFGASFFVFKTVSLVIDCYRQPLPRFSVFTFIGFILFFPAFLSGPLDRYSNFVRSLTANPDFSATAFLSGVYRFLTGLFKKLLIANTLSSVVTPVFDNPQNFLPSQLILAAVMFSFLIYYDFSGYCDMVIGIGQMIGLSIPENFNQPYLSVSIKDFWRRWHITLSGWFRDYLYIPLGGNRVGLPRQIINVLVVFLVTGLWHGASWNFVAWGLLHGLYQVVYLLLHPSPFLGHLPQKIKNFLGIILTFSFVTFAWIFFRAKSLKLAILYINRIFHVDSSLLDTRFDLSTLYLPLLLLAILFTLQSISRRLQFRASLKVIIAIFIFLSLVFNPTVAPQDFLYFKF